MSSRCAIARNWTANVYQSLLDLASGTREAIGGLQPRDFIDVQSFVWVVGSYPNPEP